MRPIPHFSAITLALASLAGPQARAADCALCDPDRQIYSLFREATSYRTVQGRVDKETRKSIERSLGARLAFCDLGRTSMCIVFRNRVPVGFVHARSEIGQHGAIQLVWAIDLDLRVRELRVQRSRERETPRLQRREFLDKVRGKGWQELRDCLSESRTSETSAFTRTLWRSLDIESKALISGIKTLLIIEHAFGSTLRSRILGNVHRLFPDTANATGIQVSLDDATLAAVEQRLGQRPTVIDRDSFSAWRSLDRHGREQGVVVLTNRAGDPAGREIWWSVSTDGRIHDALIRSNAKAEAREHIASVRGLGLESLQDRLETSTLVRCAAEVLAILSARGIVSRN